MSKLVAFCARNLYCAALIFNCSMALFFLLVSWALGGNDYISKVFGDYAAPLLLIGIAFGFWRSDAFARGTCKPNPLCQTASTSIAE